MLLLNKFIIYRNSPTIPLVDLPDDRPIRTNKIILYSSTHNVKIYLKKHHYKLVSYGSLVMRCKENSFEYYVDKDLRCGLYFIFYSNLDYDVSPYKRIIESVRHGGIVWARNRYSLHPIKNPIIIPYNENESKQIWHRIKNYLRKCFNKV